MEFETSAQAQEAKKYNDTMLKGRLISVKENNYKSVTELVQSDRTKRVFVGNLSYVVTNEILLTFMRKAGKITYLNIFLNDFQKSRGCGIVEYATVEEAETAVSTLHDQMLMGRPALVREDREDDVPETEDSTMIHPSHRLYSVYVSNLCVSIDRVELKNHMSSAGEVVKVSLLLDGKGGSKGCALVYYRTEAEMKSACFNLYNSELKGRLLFVREDKEMPPPSPLLDEDDDEPNGDDKVSETTSKSKGKVKVPSIYVAENTLYVGNLSWRVTSTILKQFMESINYEVKRVAIYEADGRSKGCGVVEYSCSNAALKALAVLKGKNLSGRKLFLCPYNKK